MPWSWPAMRRKGDGMLPRACHGMLPRAWRESGASCGRATRPTTAVVVVPDMLKTRGWFFELNTSCGGGAQRGALLCLKRCHRELYSFYHTQKRARGRDALPVAGAAP